MHCKSMSIFELLRWHLHFVCIFVCMCVDCVMCMCVDCVMCVLCDMIMILYVICYCVQYYSQDNQHT